MQSHQSTALQTIEAKMQTKLAQQKLKEHYYRHQLDQLRTRYHQFNDPTNFALTLPSQTNLKFSQMTQSKVLLNKSQIQPNNQNALESKAKKKISFEAEYHKCSKEIHRLFEQLSKSQIFTASKKTNNNGFNSSKQLSPGKQEGRECDQQHHIFEDLGNGCQLISMDEIVQNLMKKVGEEEKRLVRNIELECEFGVRQKGNAVMQKMREKNVQRLYELRQEMVEREMRGRQSNRDIVFSGYTWRMKEQIRRKRSE